MTRPEVPAAEQQVSLERMRWWDLDEVLPIERERFGDHAWTPAQFWSELARVPESRWYLVARSEGRVVGYAGVFLVGAEADVQTVAVAAEAQGQGIGRHLVEALARHAGRARARVLHLEVRADNEPALALYRRMGFASDGRRRDYYGRGRDAVLMSLRLTAPLDAGHLDTGPPDTGPPPPDARLPEVAESTRSSGDQAMTDQATTDQATTDQARTGQAMNHRAATGYG